MPSPITHIVLADKVFDKYFSDKDRKAFFVGTSFPDIRYYDNLDREKTHQDGLNIERIGKESSFLAGMHFHAFVDEKWGDFYQWLEEHPFYIEPHQVSVVALKFFEDERLYGRFKEWEQIAEFFDGVLDEEKKFEIAEKDILRWHGFLRQYFIKKPNDQTRRPILMDAGLNSDFADQVNLFIEQMRGDKRIIEAIDDFYDKFESLL
ncbi:hypothetical protein KJ866_01325 [Patescibacteria group bacterium]|nr:hypothetical protein [Patescibacteria group bacterium]MBU2265054.1 hypothetical protein [Patescibacteria group bacterium]